MSYGDNDAEVKESGVTLLKDAVPDSIIDPLYFLITDILDIVAVFEGFVNPLTSNITCILVVVVYDSDTVIVVDVMVQLIDIVDGWTIVQIPLVDKYPEVGKVIVRVSPEE